MSLRRRTLAALGLALLLGGSAAMAATRYPTGRLLVADTPVPAAKVLDARALPDMAGKPSLMLTLDAATAEAIAGPLAADAAVPVTLDGAALGTSPAGALKSDHILQLSGAFGDYAAAAALARRISGADPLPDSEGD